MIISMFVEDNIYAEEGSLAWLFRESGEPLIVNTDLVEDYFLELIANEQPSYTKRFVGVLLNGERPFKDRTFEFKIKNYKKFKILKDLLVFS